MTSTLQGEGDPSETLQSGQVVVERFPLGRHRTNTYLVYGTTGREGVLIDPAAAGDVLLSRVAALGVTLRAVILTHGHWDHVGAARYIADHGGVAVHLHAADKLLLKAAPIYAFRISAERLQVPSDTTDLHDGTTLTFGDDLALTIHHVPGHTPGGVACRVGTLLFSGDTLLREAAGRHDLPGGDASALRASMRRLQAELTPHDIVCPGHGRVWPAAEALAWLDQACEARP